MSKFCVNCGTALEDDAAFCPNCGTSQQAEAAPQPTPQPNAYTQPNTYAQPQSAPYSAPVNININGANQQGRTSCYDGSVLDTLVNAIVASLIMTISCGLATPWALVYMYKFILSHVVIDGKRLTFDGDGTSLFGQWLVWMLLTIVTCGIYGFWVAPKMYNWVASHTHFQQ